MAIDQHSTSRRAVIGALAAAPIVAAAGVVEAAAQGGAFMHRSSIMNMPAEIFDISPVARWERALTTYRRLKAEWAAHPYGRTVPGSPDYERLEAEEGAIAERASQALRAVLRTAVPDHAALVEKMEVFELGVWRRLGRSFCPSSSATLRRLSAGRHSPPSPRLRRAAFPSFGLSAEASCEGGEPSWIRTSDLLIKSQLLYRLSYGPITAAFDLWTRGQAGAVNRARSWRTVAPVERVAPARGELGERLEHEAALAKFGMGDDRPGPAPGAAATTG